MQGYATNEDVQEIVSQEVTAQTQQFVTQEEVQLQVNNTLVGYVTQQAVEQLIENAIAQIDVGGEGSELEWSDDTI